MQFLSWPEDFGQRGRQGQPPGIQLIRGRQLEIIQRNSSGEGWITVARGLHRRGPANRVGVRGRRVIAHSEGLLRERATVVQLSSLFDRHLQWADEARLSFGKNPICLAAAQARAARTHHLVPKTIDQTISALSY